MAQTETSPAAVERVVSIDAFRGMTMIFMFSAAFGLNFFADHPVIGPVAAQFDHQPWEGMTAWDLIQPFFMFIVGAVMPISFARRWAAGQSWGRSFLHVLRRSALLILFGLLARSIQAGQPTLDLINVLGQLGFTYLVAFLVLRKSWQVQGAVALALLGAHWALYQFVSAPGVAGPWVRDANIGWVLDKMILGKTWRGSYATINCVSSAANTIFGLMAGRLLTSGLPVSRVLRILAATGVAALAAGLALSPAVPIIKKIWTASFALYSTGYTLLVLLLFYWIIEVKKVQRWSKVLVVVGANSIFIYLFHEILHRWLEHTGLVFTGWAVEWWGPWGQMLNTWLVVGFQIYVCGWLYKRKIFFKI